MVVYLEGVCRDEKAREARDSTRGPVRKWRQTLALNVTFSALDKGSAGEKDPDQSGEIVHIMGFECLVE